MYAIVKSGGKQYRVEEGSFLNVEKLPAEPGTQIVLDKVLAVGEGEELQIGRPYVDTAKVNCEVVEQKRGKKIVIFKHKKRKDYRRRAGHRQDFTKLKVKEIQA